MTASPNRSRYASAGLVRGLTRRGACRFLGLSGLVALGALSSGLPAAARAAEAAAGAAGASAAADLSSAEVSRLFGEFAKTRRMPAALGRWLGDPALQLQAPYRVFDDVWNVGVKWVSAYLVKTADGWVLIDTTHEPFAEKLPEHIEAAGARLEDVKLVLMTHGHFDHVGGARRLRPLLPNARFAMSRRGWREAFESAKASEGRRNAWRMLDAVDMTLKDGETIEAGGKAFLALETPGHTWGTCSYLYDVKWGGEAHRAATIGGQDLNAIEGPEQLEAFIASMKRLGDPAFGVDVDLTAHPFTTGLTELIPAIRALRPGEKHPLVDRAGYLARLERLIRGAEAALAGMRR